MVVIIIIAGHTQQRITPLYPRQEFRIGDA